ncbi:pyridoxal phosphate-dependent transferase [Glomus cerebriforme]|uniref:Pyridoxal phosphate-dependent transferase n=1 Tax=Glomus cerebriforme TaxID=658196 RepID=A0A397SX18_9GLOM|nr:pyridoxal phosphate-dependent transferase [Glomus cerebriforme]
MKYYNYFPTRKFQIYQIFASNTNLGKTIFSTGLIRSSISKSHNNKYNYYLKPIQTGYPKDDDSNFVKTYIPKVIFFENLIKFKTLFKYEKPVSPHLAADNSIPSDENVLNKIKDYVSECYNESLNNGGRLFLETAGGVSSPVMSGTIQSEFYRVLRLPTILVGDSNLGGISTTLSSYESLLIRGYDIPIILLFNNENYNNHLFIEKYFNENQNSSIITPKIFSIQLPPKKECNDLTEYFQSNDENFKHVIDKLEEWHENRFNRFDEMERKAKETVWWPFTQHDKVNRVNVVDSAYKDLLINYNDNNNNAPSLSETFDGSASWWTQGLGHGNTKLTLTASYASGRYGHILFPESIHEPSLSLSESLLDGVGKNWADRVFYSDNGSTAMEVALKMALTEDYKEKGKETLILGLEGSYHGDTIGVMDACGPNIYNQKVTWYAPKGIWFTPPKILMKNNKYKIHTDINVSSYDSLSEIFSENRIDNDQLSYHYKQSIENQLYHYMNQGYKFGALIIEPVVMGAGGMIFVDPLYQHQLIKSVRSILKIPIIFDEVFTGFWRLGKQSGAEFLKINPDIAAYAKLLTGGLCPLAVTLSTEEIFKKFLGDTKVEALLHGHSYTAHPIGCLVGNTSVHEYYNLDWNKERECEEQDKLFSIWRKDILQQISCLPNVNGVFALGTLLSIELNDIDGGGYASNVAKLLIEKLSTFERNSIDDFGIKTRPLGNVVYIMSSLISDKKSIRNIEQKILKCLNS